MNAVKYVGRPARFDPATQQRRAMMAKIQIARKDLAMDEDDYRQALLDQTGHLSLTECSERELVAKLVDGFRVDGFWTALWASLFIALLSLVLVAFVLGGSPEFTIETGPAPGQVWL